MLNRRINGLFVNCNAKAYSFVTIYIMPSFIRVYFHHSESMFMYVQANAAKWLNLLSF